MPHVIVKLYSGRSEQQKARLAQEITKAVMTTLKADDESVSVAFAISQPEDVDINETLFRPNQTGTLSRQSSAAAGNRLFHSAD